MSNYDKDTYNRNAPPAPQQAVTPTIGGGSPVVVQVLPPSAGSGNRPSATTASVTGDTPVFKAYQHN